MLADVLVLTTSPCVCDLCWHIERGCALVYLLDRQILVCYRVLGRQHGSQLGLASCWILAD